jgi:flagellar basal-body rod modification protein FlgD
MNIQDLFPPTTTAHVAQPKKQLGQEDFMKLLVAQMNNQDPSSPTDNTAFMAQLTQFSMADGITKLGKTFDSVAGNMTNAQAMQAASLVGHQVLAEGNVAQLEEGRPVVGRITVPQSAAGINLQVRDAAGSLVKTVPATGMTPGDHDFVWDGTNEHGDAQPAGDYTITATALVNGQQQAVALQLYNTVQGVSLGADHSTIELQLPGQQSVNFAKISQYR